MKYGAVYELSRVFQIHLEVRKMCNNNYKLYLSIEFPSFLAGTGTLQKPFCVFEKK